MWREFSRLSGHHDTHSHTPARDRCVLYTEWNSTTTPAYNKIPATKIQTNFRTHSTTSQQPSTWLQTPHINSRSVQYLKELWFLPLSGLHHWHLYFTCQWATVWLSTTQPKYIQTCGKKFHSHKLDVTWTTLPVLELQGNQAPLFLQQTPLGSEKYGI